MTKQDIKRLVPKIALEYYRKFRRWERFNYRYKYNKGKSFIKNISIFETKFKIVINPYRNCCVDDFIAQDGCWEPKVSEKIMKFLPPDGVFIDVGANIGYHSLFAATLYNRTTSVFAFEPQKEIYDMVLESIRENLLTNIKVFNIGLSNTQCSAELNIFEENKGAASLVKGLNHHVGTTSKQTIELKTLDSFESQISGIDVIKIDVEGFEFETILGAEKLIRKFKPVLLVEFSPGLYLVRDQKIVERLISKLEDLDYRILTLEEEEIDLRKWTNSNHTDTSQIDIICLPK